VECICNKCRKEYVLGVRIEREIIKKWVLKKSLVRKATITDVFK
jgi:hypothetical protein